MKKAYAFIALLIVFLVIGGFLYLSKVRTESQPTATNTNPGPMISSSTPIISDTVQQPEGNTKNFNDPNGTFSLFYPEDYTLDTQNNGQYVRLYKRGESQRPQSEMSDGTLMVFESITLNGKTLNNWIDEHIKSTTADGTLTVVSPKKAVQIGGYPGFMYVTRGLGESSNYFLQKDSKSDNALSVTVLVTDPQNKGYQKEVDNTLTQIKILK